MTFQGIIYVNNRLVAKMKCGCERNMVSGATSCFLALRKEIAKALGRSINYILLYLPGKPPLKDHDNIISLDYKKVYMIIGPQGCPIHGNYVKDDHKKKAKCSLTRRFEEISKKIAGGSGKTKIV